MGKIEIRHELRMVQEHPERVLAYCICGWIDGVGTADQLHARYAAHLPLAWQAALSE